MLLTLFFGLLQAIDAPRVLRDVSFRKVDEVELRLDAYLPVEKGAHAAVLLVHGGAWMHGDKGDVAELGQILARKGFACFSPDYRLAPAHQYPAQIEDCLYAVQFLRSHAGEYGVDAQQIGAMGFSAGGHLVELLGVLDERADPKAADPVLHESSRVQCVVSYFGPALLSRVQELDFDTRPPPELFGDAGDEAYAAASPVNYVTRDDAPFLLVHGDADTIVPIGHSHLFEEKLHAAGVPCELVVIPGGGHGDFLFRDPFGDYWKRTEEFLAQRLQAK